MRFMLWYLGLTMHIAGLVLMPSAARGWWAIVALSCVLWSIFGAGLVIAALVRRIKQASPSRFTPREVANLTKKGGE